MRHAEIEQREKSTRSIISLDSGNNLREKCLKCALHSQIHHKYHRHESPNTNGNNCSLALRLCHPYEREKMHPGDMREHEHFIVHVFFSSLHSYVLLLPFFLRSFIPRGRQIYIVTIHALYFI